VAVGHASATSTGGASGSTKLTAETLQRMEALEQEHHKLREENAAMKEGKPLRLGHAAGAYAMMQTVRTSVWCIGRFLPSADACHAQL
jgi:hypothetical protein